MIYKFKVLILILIIILVSCSKKIESNAIRDLEENIYKIEIVNNEKWEVEKEMMTHIQNMKSDIYTTQNEHNPNYKELGFKLEENVKLLTSDCTMIGKAHDELHKWLLPFIELVKELNGAVSIEEQKKSFEALQQSMHEFNTYFK